MRRLLEKLPPLPTKDSIHLEAKKLRLAHYDINDDLSVSVSGSVKISGNHLTTLPFKFHIVSGDFEVNENKLSNFKRFPFWVGGDITARHNHLTHFLDYHTECRGSLNFSFNRIKSLQGLPMEVNGKLDCSHNLLENLNGLPQKIEGYLDCGYNRLSTLKGAEQCCLESFMTVANNKALRNLEGLPNIIKDKKTGSHTLFFYDQPLIELRDLTDKAEKLREHFNQNQIISNMNNILEYIMHGGKYCLLFDEVKELQQIYMEKKKLHLGVAVATGSNSNTPIDTSAKPNKFKI